MAGRLRAARRLAVRGLAPDEDVRAGRRAGRAARCPRRCRARCCGSTSTRASTSREGQTLRPARGDEDGAGGARRRPPASSRAVLVAAGELVSRGQALVELDGTSERSRSRHGRRGRAARRPAERGRDWCRRPTKVRFVELLAAPACRWSRRRRSSSRRAVPQLADAEEVLPAVDRREGVRYPVLVPNMRGLERAEAAGADAIAVFTAASEAFARANVNMTIAESLDAFGPVLDRAARARDVDARVRVDGVRLPLRGAGRPGGDVARVAARCGAGVRRDLDRRHDRRGPAGAGAGSSRRCRATCPPSGSRCTCTTRAAGRWRTSRPGLEAGHRASSTPPRRPRRVPVRPRCAGQPRHRAAGRAARPPRHRPRRRPRPPHRRRRRAALPARGLTRV